jgi:hypothetical protein
MISQYYLRKEVQQDFQFQLSSYVTNWCFLIEDFGLGSQFFKSYYYVKAIALIEVSDGGFLFF